MTEEKKKSKSIFRDVSFSVLKATVKATIFYVIYLFVASLLAPLFGLIPGFMESIEAFVAVYIVLMILSNLTERTVFQHFFSTARALFFMAYLLFSIGDGVVSVSYENFNLTLNLTMFYIIAMTLSLLSFARAILQAISFMSERAEESSGLQPPSKSVER